MTAVWVWPALPLIYWQKGVEQSTPIQSPLFPLKEISCCHTKPIISYNGNYYVTNPSIGHGDSDHNQSKLEIAV